MVMTKPRAAAKPKFKDEEAGAITLALREAMAEQSAYRLAAASGVNVAAVLRFKSGERSLDLRSVDRLCRVLGLELKRRGK